ncbi:MAG TPA: hypothetical protein VFU88_02660 [Ktedonobacterales bacterium]|nr:hypothetical protein [Ktedonobacterales bacterium]
MPNASTSILKAAQDESFSYVAHFTRPKLCSVLHDRLQQRILRRWRVPMCRLEDRLGLRAACLMVIAAFSFALDHPLLS